MDIPASLSLILQFIALSASCLALYSVLLRNRKNGGNTAPEPTGAWPIIGHLHLLAGGDHLLYRTLGKMADTYGPAFNIRLGSRRAFVVSSWEVAKECFTANDKALASRPTTVATKHMGYNNAVFGFAPNTPFMREMRKIATLELLSNRRLELLKGIRISEISAGVRDLYASVNGGGKRVELNKWMDELTLNMVVRMVAGKSYFRASAPDHDAGEARRCKLAISEFFRLIGMFVVSDALPFLAWFDLQGCEKAMKKTAGELDVILEGWLVEHRRRRASSRKDGGSVRVESDDKDFIDVMLSIEEQGKLSNFQHDAATSVKSTCLALILGGSDTNAGTMTWAISLLLNNPHALKKVQEELDLKVGRDRKVEDSDIKDLPYLQAVVKETLRLYPAGPLLGPREAQEDCTVSGYHVPAGTRLVVNVWKIHRDPKVWPEPEAFKPERFVSTHAHLELKPGGQFELMPFGSGRRSCPGSSFALQVIYLTLARVLQAFDFANPSEKPVDMTESPGLTIPKAKPLEVLLNPRLSAELYGI